MSISSSDVTSGPHLCNGATVTFSFNFRIAAYGDVSAADQIKVILVSSSGAETVLTEGVSANQYAVTVNADQDSSPGGSITTVSTYASGNKIYIRLKPSFTQQTELANQSPYNASVIEDQLDQTTRQILDMNDRLRRVPFGGVQFGESFDGEVASAPVAGYGFYVNNNLDGFYLGAPASVAVSAALTAFVQSASIAEAAGLIGAGGLSAKAYGAAGDGATDDTAEIQAALDAAALLGTSGNLGGTVLLPPGVYLISGLLTVPARVTLAGLNSGSSIIKFDASATAANMVSLGNESEVRNLQLDGSNKATTGVLFAGCENAVASDVYCYDMANQGFATVAGAHDCQIHQCTAESCGDRGLNIGGGLSNQDPSYRINVSHFTSIDNEDAGILLGHSVHDCSINGFVISGTNSADIWLVANCYRNVFKNGTCSAPNADAGDDAQGIWVTQKCYDNIFEGITVHGHLIGITVQGDEISSKTDADTAAGDGDTYGNIFSNITLVGRGSGTANGEGIRLVSHASYQVQFNKFSNFHVSGFASGIVAADTNLGDQNSFLHVSFNDVTTKVSFGATQYRKQRFFNIDGITNAGFLASGDANGVSPPAFPNSATEVFNPYPYACEFYVNHDGDGGSLSSLQIIGNGQSNASGYNAAGTPRDSMLCVPHRIPAGGSVILAYGTGTAADYSWQWFAAGP